MCRMPHPPTTPRCRSGLFSDADQPGVRAEVKALPRKHWRRIELSVEPVVRDAPTRGPRRQQTDGRPSASFAPHFLTGGGVQRKQPNLVHPHPGPVGLLVEELDDQFAIHQNRRGAFAAGRLHRVVPHHPSPVPVEIVTGDHASEEPDPDVFTVRPPCPEIHLARQVIRTSSPP